MWLKEMGEMFLFYLSSSWKDHLILDHHESESKSCKLFHCFISEKGLKLNDTLWEGLDAFFLLSVIFSEFGKLPIPWYSKYVTIFRNVLMELVSVIFEYLHDHLE